MLYPFKRLGFSLLQSSNTECGRVGNTVFLLTLILALIIADVLSHPQLS